MRPQTFFPLLQKFHLGMVILCLLVLALLREKGFQNFKDPQVRIFICLLVFMGIHVPLAVNTFFAFFTLRSVAEYFVVYLAIITFLNSWGRVDQFINWLIGFSVICAAIGLISGGVVPNSGIMGDGNDFALAMNVIIPFSYFMYIGTAPSVRKYFYLVATLLMIIANLISFSRGGFIGLIAVSMYCWYRAPRKLLSAIAIVITAFIILTFIPSKYLDRISTIKGEISNVTQGSSDSGGTATERWYSWKIGARIFLNFPLIGVGQGNFPWHFAEFEPSEGLRGRLHGGRVSHSIYFTVLPELGLVGILLFGGMIFYMMKYRNYTSSMSKGSVPIKDLGDTHGITQGTRKLHFILLGHGGALIGYFVTGAFLTVIYDYPYFWMLLGLSVSLKKVINAQSQTQNGIVNS